MAKKRYISLTGIQYTFPVTTEEKQVWVSFNGTGNDYLTSSKIVQEAIEAHDKFKCGEIGLHKNEEEEEENEQIVFEYAEFPDVTDTQGAKDILRNSPYKISTQSLRTPDAILRKAKEHNVAFPNWNAE